MTSGSIPNIAFKPYIAVNFAVPLHPVEDTIGVAGSNSCRWVCYCGTLYVCHYGTPYVGYDIILMGHPNRPYIYVYGYVIYLFTGDVT